MTNYEIEQWFDVLVGKAQPSDHATRQAAAIRDAIIAKQIDEYNLPPDPELAEQLMRRLERQGGFAPTRLERIIKLLGSIQLPTPSIGVIALLTTIALSSHTIYTIFTPIIKSKMSGVVTEIAGQSDNIETGITDENKSKSTYENKSASTDENKSLSAYNNESESTYENKSVNKFGNYSENKILNTFGKSPENKTLNNLAKYPKNTSEKTYETEIKPEIDPTLEKLVELLSKEYAYLLAYVTESGNAGTAQAYLNTRMVLFAHSEWANNPTLSHDSQHNYHLKQATISHLIKLKLATFDPYALSLHYKNLSIPITPKPNQFEQKINDCIPNPLDHNCKDAMKNISILLRGHIYSTKVNSLNRLYFKGNAAYLSAEHRQQLTEMAANMNVTKLPSSRFLIFGYADKRGNVEGNAKLSYTRALAVREYLISKGVAAERLIPFGLGSKAPVEGSKPMDEVNRRVEIWAVDD